MAAYKDEARGTWYVSFHYNDWTGKNKRKLKRGFRTRTEALEYEQKFLLQQATNRDMMFADFYKLYEEDFKPKLKLNTWRTKDVIFQKKLIPYFKDKKMNEISPADIIKWQNEMIKKRQADDKPYKPTYLKTMQSELSAIFNHAVRFYNLRENPVKKAGTIGKGKADEMDFWTKEEYLKFIECVKDKPISYYAFQILYWCGIREGELLALTLADIDFENKKLHITKSYQYINGEDIITDPKTEKSRRDVVIPDFLVEELRQFIGMLYGYGRDDRIYAVAELIRRNVDLGLIYNTTKIDMFFLEKIKHIIKMENKLKDNVENIEILKKAKKMGFSDKYIGEIWNKTEEEIYLLRKEENIYPTYKMIDTCASEFESYVPYFYSTYEEENESIVSNKKKIIVL